MANPLKVLTELQVSGALSTSGSVVIGGNGTLAVTAGSTTLQGLSATTLSASSTLQVTGAATLAGGLTVTGAALNASAVAVSASAISSSGAAIIGGSLTVGGDLTVAGTTTTVNSQNLLIADKKIVIASGSTAGTANIDGAGVYFGNEDSSFARLSFSSASDGSSHKLSTNLYLDVASDKGYAINSNPIIQAKLGGINLGFASNEFGNLYARTGTLAWTYGDNSPGGGSELRSTAGIYMGEHSSSFGIHKGTFIQGSGSFISVQDDVIAFYDTSVGSLKTLSDLIPSANNVTTTQYKNLRSSITGSKQSGGDTTVTFLLSGSVRDNASGRTPTGSAVTGLSASSGNASALISALSYASIDVAVKAAGTTIWTNDLVSVTVTASSAINGYHWPLITVDLPGAADNTSVRLIVVNEDQINIF